MDGIGEDAIYVLLGAGLAILTFLFWLLNQYLQYNNSPAAATASQSQNTAPSHEPTPAQLLPPADWSTSSIRSSSSADIEIRLKWRESIRTERVSHNTSVQELRERCFAEQLRQNLVVRLLFAGRILADRQKLGECGIVESGSTIIALITASQNQASSQQPRNTDFFSQIPGGEVTLLMGLVGTSLLCFWFLLLMKKEEFGTPINFMLLGVISGLYFMFIWLLKQQRQQQLQQPQQQIHQHID